MRLIYLMTLALSIIVISGADSAIAKDDGGFGATRFSAQAPKALGGSEVMSAEIMTPPSDIEPASGEEDITPESEPIGNAQDDSHLQHSDTPTETYTIKKDLSVR